MDKLLRPSVTLLIKLGSIITHLEEFMSDDGHPLDKQAADVLLQDPEVVEWMRGMSKAAFLPLKRRANR